MGLERNFAEFLRRNLTTVVIEYFTQFLHIPDLILNMHVFISVCRFISLTIGQWYKSHGKDNEFEYNFLLIHKYLTFVKQITG